MGSDKPPLTLIWSPASLDELHDIWRWNAQQYGVLRADNYLRYLNDEIARLASTYAKGKAVTTRPDLRYAIIRRRAKGHGHVAVYNFDDQEVHLLHVFHTAQDGENRVAAELE